MNETIAAISNITTNSNTNPIVSVSNQMFDGGYNSSMISNMIIATTISSFMSLITGFIPKICDRFTYYMNIMYNYLFKKKNCSINIVGTTRINNYGININFSNEYCAIMSMINKKGINLYDITFMNSNTLWDDGGKSMKNFDFYVNTDKKIFIEGNTKDKNVIFATFYQSNEEVGKEGSCKIKYLTMKVSSETLSVNQIQQKVNEWTKIYIHETQRYVDDGSLYYYSLNNKQEKVTSTSKDNKDKDDNNTKNERNSHSWEKNILTTFKTFDNIFFTDKNMLLKKINYF